MRALIPVTLLFLSGASFAADYHLDPEKWCSSTGDQLEFKCSPASEKYKIFIYQNGKKWIKKHVWENPRSETKWELNVVKNNLEILILSENVFFSGTRLLHIMKKTGKYYQSEVAYASFGNEVSVTYGKAYLTSN